MYQKRGFTLIELLVVVLIIGILSSVALPQYTKAVEKSRAAEALTMVRAIRDANEVYYMANGTYAENPEDLDIVIPGSDDVLGVPRKVTKLFSYASFFPNSSGAASVAVANRLPVNTLYAFVILQGEAGVKCKFYSSKGEEICKSFGGQKISADVYSVN